MLADYLTVDTAEFKTDRFDIFNTLSTCEHFRAGP